MNPHHTHPQPHREKSQAGFTLLLAALIASIVLSIGSAIFEIAQKEVTLSSAGRDSQFAFYAADTAAECALYWDTRCQYFGAIVPSSCPGGQPTLPPTCGGQTLTVNGSRSGNPYTLSFSYQITTTDSSGQHQYCADVSVTKTVDAGGNVKSTVDANGYSTGCAAISSDSQTLQRSVELQY